MTDAIPRRDEVEDILFSVRKLVTQESGRKTLAPTPAAVPLPGKLVLTAELRVPSEQVPEAGAEPVLLPADEQARASARSLLQRISEQAEVAEPMSQGRADVDREPPKAEAQNSTEPLAGPDESDQDAGLELTLARLEAMLSGKTPAADAARTTEAAPEAKPQQDTARAPVAASDEPLEIDEAMLSQLVAHIVRRELQGELGEKITRAIRKLVRAEVARELALRKL
jgi:hypothetical protein